MSQYTASLDNDESVVYGYDRILRYYFVSHVTADGEVEHLVGLLSSQYGSALNALECLAELGARIPADHQIALCMDSPLQDTDGEPVAIPSGQDEVCK